MKKVFSANIALMGSDILEHPSTIYTGDNIVCETFTTHAELNAYLAQQSPDILPTLPDIGQWCEKKAYKYGVKIAVCLQPHTRMHYEPEITPALFTVITPLPPGDLCVTSPAWNQANWLNYHVGYHVRHEDKVWKAKNTTHTWIAPALTGNGAISWEWIKNCT